MKCSDALVARVRGALQVGISRKLIAGLCGLSVATVGRISNRQIKPSVEGDTSLATYIARWIETK